MPMTFNPHEVCEAGLFNKDMQPPRTKKSKPSTMDSGKITEYKTTAPKKKMDYSLSKKYKMANFEKDADMELKKNYGKSGKY